MVRSKRQKKGRWAKSKLRRPTAAYAAAHKKVCLFAAKIMMVCSLHSISEEEATNGVLFPGAINTDDVEDLWFFDVK